MFSLRKRVALVTGGAGLYGRQIVHGLAQAGANVLVASRNIAKLETYAESLRSEGLSVSAYELDQADDASVQTLRQKLLHEHGKVDVLVNNAVARTMSDWSDSLEKWEASMRVNATGIFNMTRTFGDMMAERGGGSIINIGSLMGMVGPDFSLYEGFNWNVPPGLVAHRVSSSFSAPLTTGRFVLATH